MSSRPGEVHADSSSDGQGRVVGLVNSQLPGNRVSQVLREAGCIQCELASQAAHQRPAQLLQFACAALQLFFAHYCCGSYATWLDLGAKRPKNRDSETGANMALHFQTFIVFTNQIVV